MVTRASLTNPAGTPFTVWLKGVAPFRVSIDHEARLPAQDRPTGVGDEVQFLGRKARIILVERGAIYHNGDRASELSTIAVMNGWLAAGTPLDFYSPTEQTGFSVKLRRFRPDEEPSPTGFMYRLEAVEVSQTPTGPAPAEV